MSSEEIRRKFLEFFSAKGGSASGGKSKGHAIVPSSSLIPTDPSVLLTTAGMQQFKPYFTGELDPQKDFGSKNTVSVQKSFRTSDIEEVGDERHLTFFEMLGNFSFGGYWKEDAIKLAHEFITKIMGLEIDYVTVFEGEGNMPADEESEKIWRSIDPKINVKKFGRADNFWGPTGNEGPCGPTTEIYVNGIEIWNIVFNQYYQKSDGVLSELKVKGIDTGMGLERLTMASQKKGNIFETDLFQPIIDLLTENLPTKLKRIFADHLRASIFLIADGVRPSNKDAGYVLRRLLRRMLAYMIEYDVHGNLFEAGFGAVKKIFGGIYPEILDGHILEVLEAEQQKFEKAIARGMSEMKKFPQITAKEAFYLYESFGLPFELIRELAPEASKELHRHEFDKEFKTHQETSRAGAEKKFGGHGLLLNTGELKAKDEEELKKVTRLHTATHMLQQALREVLGSEVHQAGSDITAERTRFDFSFSRKITAEEIKKVEDLVNQKVEEGLPMQKIILPKSEAEKTGALYFFKEKYPDPVNVYFLGDSIQTAWSKEFCGGPHVANSREVGKFKIIKEEAVGAGTRRIRATVGE